MTSTNLVPDERLFIDNLSFLNGAKDQCPIVGIGASAGGLQAFKRLFANIPNDTGLAFVVVQHISSDRESLLPELIGKMTTMRVYSIVEGMRIEPNQVYVIPPNCALELKNEELCLTPRPPDRSLHWPIEVFLNSLSENRGPGSVGIILSGAGSDGAEALKNLKASGGITFVQAPETAVHSSMPQEAIAADHVDFILPPEQIGIELTRMAAHIRKISDGTGERAVAVPDPTKSIANIFVLVRQSTGVDFTHYKPSTISRRMARRMAMLRMDSLIDYEAYLREKPAERIALYNDFLINVTSFFRDTETFEALKKHVLPKLAAAESGSGPLRIWIPASSTGEEVYSLAICLLESVDRDFRRPIQIFATDLSDDCVAKARAGFYPKTIEHQISPERLKRFFSEEEHGYLIGRHVRELCIFAKQDVTRDPPFSHMDFVSCRNLLIYFDLVLQKKVLKTFHYALKSTGYLLLGHSESIGSASELFEADDKEHRIYRKIKTDLKITDILDLDSPTRLAMGNTRMTSENSGVKAVQAFADRITLDRYAYPSILVDERLNIIQVRGNLAGILKSHPEDSHMGLQRLLQSDLWASVRGLVDEALSSKRSVRTTVSVKTPSTRPLLVEAFPLITDNQTDDKAVLIFFMQPASLDLGTKQETGASEHGNSPAEKLAESHFSTDKNALSRALVEIERLRHEHLATHEELQSANEEILSSNEELQSTNEELETAKEELQSSNEELATINEELQNGNFALSHVNNDLLNLLDNISFPIVMVGNDLSVRRFTKTASTLFNLIPSDVGRSISHIRTKLTENDLEGLLWSVIKDLKTISKEVQDQNGGWHMLRIRPYKTEDNKLEGAILMLIDIGSQKFEEKQVALVASAISAIVDDALLILNADLTVKHASPSLLALLNLQSSIEGQYVYDFAGGILKKSEMQNLLENSLRRQAEIKNLAVATNAVVPMVLNVSGRAVYTELGNVSMFLLAFNRSERQKL